MLWTSCRQPTYTRFPRPLATACCCLGIALTLITQIAAAVERAELLQALDSITNGELKKHVEVLADDSFEGREAGSRGGQAAAKYLAKVFEQQGLIPSGDGGSYFQGFNNWSRNILGRLEGSDQQLKAEVIVIGAHYDHVGYGRQGNSFGPFGYIHNGADDNASGVAGLLEMLDAVKKLKTPPKRTILFCLWDGEEQGLLGSRFWISRPTVPLEHVAIYINLDMIGRLKNKRVEVYGTRTSAGLRRLVSECNDAQLDLDFDWRIKEDSDHHPFFAHSIPILMLHTGLHEDYHRPSDDVHLLDVDGMKQVAGVTLQCLLRLADAPKIGKFREASRLENNHHRQILEQPVAVQPPRFGVPWKKEAGENLKLVFQPPIPGSPAEKAGLRDGDVLLTCDGQEITDETRFRWELFAARGPQVFRVARKGEKEPREITITPRGEPIRVGLTWRTDDAEPSSAILTQIIPGSPAQVAGLQLKDRIYALNGQSLQGSDEFSKSISALAGPLEFSIERGGKLQVVKVAVLPVAAASP